MVEPRGRGWHQHPDDPDGVQRWFDGTQWTHRTTGRPRARTEPPRVGTNGRPLAGRPEACVRWAAQTIGELAELFGTMSLAVQEIDLGDRGAALALRTAGGYYAVVLAAATEGPSRVVLTTGVLRDLDPDQRQDALNAANDFNRTRTGGQCVVSASPRGGLVVTMQSAIGPAILSAVPGFARAQLDGFAGDAGIARRYFKDRYIAGSPFLWNEPADLMDLLATVDVETDVLLDLADLITEQ